MSKTPLPLDDLLVVDFSRVLSGPFCAMLLGGFGARVLKIERPGEGDDTRGYGPPFVGGESAYFLSINHDKESLAVDLKSEEGRGLVRRLLARADVALENFRPGAMDRLGLGPREALALNPRLVYASISGFGHAGLPEHTRRPGYDLILQGLGGLASLTGPEDGDGPPYKVGVSIADMAAGLYALIGILVALRVRDHTGRGQHVDVSMLDGQISLLTYHAGMYFATGAAPARLGNKHPSITPYETYRAADGFLNVGCGNDSLFRALARVLGRPALAEDPRFQRNADRVRNRRALAEILEPIFAARPVGGWVADLDAAGIPAGPILGVAEALAHPQLRARGMIADLPHATAGEVRVTGVPVRLAETPGAVRRAAPRLGEHTRPVLRDLLGLTDNEIGELAARGVVAGA